MTTVNISIYFHIWPSKPVDVGVSFAP